MIMHLIALIVAFAITIRIFGWFYGLAGILLFCIYAHFSPRKKSGPILSFIEKLGMK